MHHQMMDPIGPARAANFLGHHFLVRYRPHASQSVDLESTPSPINPLHLSFGRSSIPERQGESGVHERPRFTSGRNAFHPAVSVKTLTCGF